MFPLRPRFAPSTRRGTLLPAIAAAILTVGCCLALVLDRLWLDAARGELRTAVEAAALAAAARLVDDERINEAVEPEGLAEAARQAAAEAAAGNLVAGLPLSIDPTLGGHVHLGRYVLHAQSGQYHFLETEYFPTAVHVEGARSRAVGNPVARLFAGLTGEAGGDAVAAATAVLSNTVVGLRPSGGMPVPAWPLAVYERDPAGERRDTWEAAIEQGLGPDQYAFDRETNRVHAGGDGLPEITLHFRAPGDQPEDPNVWMIDVGNGLTPDQLAQQVRRGWSAADLSQLGGELRVDAGNLALEGASEVDSLTAEALTEMIGQKRIVLLYSAHAPRKGGGGAVVISRLAAGRIMAVEASPGGAVTLVLQPAVLATRTALLADSPSPLSADEDAGNPYLYKISLTQ